MKILAILGHGNSLQEPLYRNYGCDVFYVYKKVNKFSSVIRRLIMETSHSKKYVSWLFKNINLSQYDVIILNECIFPAVILNYIRYCNQNCKLIYIYWNTVFFNIPNNVEPRMYNSERQYYLLRECARKTKTEIVSFDKKDCETLGFIYNGQCCIDYRDKFIFDRSKKVDIFFCGQDKGRRDYINNLIKDFEQLGITYEIILKSKVSSNDKIKYINVPLSYESVLHRMWESKAILDIVQTGQCGMTWRPIEALFYKKKLITTFQDIKKFDFYNKKNIFILGIDRMDELKKFLNDEYEEINSEIIEKYTFKKWLERIINRK